MATVDRAAGVPSKCFARHYVPDRPRLSPPLMQRVGGGFKELPPSVFDEVASMHSVTERMRIEKERVDALLKEREAELSRVRAEVQAAVARGTQAEDREAKREAMLGGELHRACEQLEQAQRQLAQEQSTSRADRERSAEEMRQLRAQLDEATTQTEARKRQIAELLTHMAEQEQKKEARLLQMASEVAEARAAASEARREVAAAKDQLAERDGRIEILKVRRVSMRGARSGRGAGGAVGMRKL